MNFIEFFAYCLENEISTMVFSGINFKKGPSMTKIVIKGRDFLP